jgi:AAA domain, putative AbiEii toxin, Type IV TA system
MKLVVENFAQIERAEIDFRDLTVLVGPQASGKSLLLQWFKVALDMGEIIHALRQAGHDVKEPNNLLDLVFGEGMSASWSSGSKVSIDGRSIGPVSWSKGVKNKEVGKVFYIPAHRALLLADGWPAPFQKLNADTPVVARLFSQNLYQRFSGRQASSLFPVERLLKEEYRSLIDTSIFHGGSVDLEKEGLKYRLRLSYDQHIRLPFMTWTSGQREFTPLLLGLYHVLAPRKLTKRPDVDWVIIEEPEMGLHPNAIAVCILLILDLLWRGYRVVMSTHSPLVLDIIWAIRGIAASGKDWQLLATAFSVKDARSVRNVMEHALDAQYGVYYLSQEPSMNGRVASRDISGLDPNADDDSEAYWGGLTGFSSRFGRAVRTAVNQSGQA